MKSSLLIAFALLGGAVGSAAAQPARDTARKRVPDPTSFSFMFENDTFNKSDSAYTNGVRLSWGIMRHRPAMKALTDYNLVSLLDRGVDRGLQFFGADSAHWLADLGIIPRTTPRAACPKDPDRTKLYRNRPCTVLTFSLAQIMYTPDTLMGTTVVTHSRPYAGFLYATVGVTTLSADSASWLAFSEVSNQFLLGVTGHPSGAEDTQSWAHWVMATGAHRPLGWDTQLRFWVHPGFINDIVLRPRVLEHCAGPKLPGVPACDGTVDEQRRTDLSVHSELVTTTHMLRYSLGLIARAGSNYPDAVGALRIPVSKGNRGCGRCSLWWNVFVDIEGRVVPYNSLISGGIPDGGPAGWRTVSQIRARSLVAEGAAGLSFGTRDVSGRIEMTSRTPEYDVIGRGQPKVMNGFMTFMLAIHPTNPR